jgi:flagellar protein FliO/FliZ
MDVVDWARALAALIGTLALLGLLAVLARRFNMIQPLRAGADRRLAVVETLMLDPRRKLVIVRDGGREHLLLLSPFGDARIDSRTAPLLAVEETPPEAPIAPRPEAVTP